MIALLSTTLAGSPQLATFDHVVKRIPEVQVAEWDATDWNSTAASLRKRAKKAKSPDELRPVLGELLGSLGDSHYAVLPRSWDPEAEDSLVSAGLGAGAGGTAGLAFATLGTDLIVRRVTPGSPADKAGVKPGAAVISVDGQPIEPVVKALFAGQKPAAADLMLRGFVRSRVDGPVDATAELDLDGEVLEVGRISEGVFVSPGFGHMPAMASVWTEQSLPLPNHPGSARVVAIEVFVLPVLPRFQASVEAAIAGDDALLLDLRGNPGGVLGVGQGMAGFLVDSAMSLGTTKAAYGTLDLMVNPRPARQRFTGPVAILIDRASASTSEILAAGLSSVGRARVFGSTSAGMALPSRMESLPNGDVLQLATGDYVTPDGVRLEGVGFTPDAPVELTREALQAGADPVLEAALAWLASTVPAPEETP